MRVRTSRSDPCFDSSEAAATLMRHANGLLEELVKKLAGVLF
jgi:hypothetical protein